MRVLFCDFDGGNVLFEEERNDIPSLMALFNSNGGRLMLQYDGDQYFYGSLQECCMEMLEDEDTEERYEVVKLFFAKELRKVSIRGNIFPYSYYSKEKSQKE
ncbi:hypothetical protein [Paenibacillus mesotrionivorans]|jgi:hypothetical protein|uniref:Uncharacterized protein n=1 Tax=Paenibacillus mesotrionivorans TaxID=3160968 RepID=A0ACC7NSV3_9BACL